MLREVLADDPADDAFSSVAEELLSRGEFGAAFQILDRAQRERVDGLGEHEGLLARAAAQVGQHRACLASLGRLAPGWEEAPELARAEVFALAGTGDVARARVRAADFLERFDDADGVKELLHRLDAPPPDPRVRARDPFYTVARAERYVLAGRVDRAVRTYRRLLHAHPEDLGLAGRLAELLREPHDEHFDDLSEELPIGENLDMPLPSLGSETEDRTTKITAAELEALRRQFALEAPESFDDEEPEDDTDRLSAASRKRLVDAAITKSTSGE